MRHGDDIFEDLVSDIVTMLLNVLHLLAIQMAAWSSQCISIYF